MNINQTVYIESKLSELNLSNTLCISISFSKLAQVHCTWHVAQCTKATTDEENLIVVIFHFVDLTLTEIFG